MKIWTWMLLAHSALRQEARAGDARAGAVAQSFTLLYRRLAVGRVLEFSNLPVLAITSQTAILRYSRVELCATVCNIPKFASVVLVAALMCGCASGPSWTRRTFAFSLPADPPATKAQTNIVALNRVSISPLFQSRSFTYRTGENSYEQDPYAGFLIPPERAMAESIRAWMRAEGVFGRVMDPGSGLTPTLVAEVSVTELYGDFRKAPQPVGALEIHFICYEVREGAPGRVVLDKLCRQETPLAGTTPAALMAAWDADLREIMLNINSEYAKAISNAR